MSVAVVETLCTTVTVVCPAATRTAHAPPTESNSYRFGSNARWAIWASTLAPIPTARSSGAGPVGAVTHPTTPRSERVTGTACDTCGASGPTA